MKTKPKNKEETGGVYKIPCKDCTKYYTGETGHTLKKRIREHKYDVATANQNNAVYKHWRDNGHMAAFDRAETILRSSNYNVRRTYEAAIIQNTLNYNIQNNVENRVCNSLVFKFIKKKNKLNIEIANKIIKRDIKI